MVMAGRKPSFFKVFFPKLSSHKLAIPRMFLSHLKDESSGTAYLTGPSGKIWSVELVKDTSGMVFKKGWVKFVADHSIETGDFLVFNYEGSLSFRVLVFDRTACEKEKAFYAKPSKDSSSISSEDEVKRNSVDNHRESPSKQQRCSSKSREEILVSSEDSTVEKSERTQSVLTARLRRSRRRSRCMSKEASKATVPPVGSKLFDDVKINRSQAMGKSTISHGRQDSAEMPIRLGGKLRSQRRPVTDEELNMTFELARSFKSKNPFTLVVMRDAYVYKGFCMSLPRPFVRMHLPKVSTELTLRDPNGKQWEVRYIYSGIRGNVSGGWGKFSYGNNLERGDVCVFELIEKKDMQVHIFRVVKELTPLLKYTKKK